MEWDGGGSEMGEWGKTLLDLLYPRLCVACGIRDPADGRHLCWDCLSEVQYIQPPFCDRCGDPVAGRVDHVYTCALCERRVVHFERARSAARYEGPVAQAVQALKYRREVWVAPDLSDLLEATVRAHYDVAAIDAVTAVPLFPARLRRREFNQAALLAGHLARRIGRPHWPRLAVRTRPTPTQTKLTVIQRADNVKNAFRAADTRRLKGRRLLLVDDVMTTGATVNECAGALKAGGAETVWVVTVARG